jgi:hypothetical protein
MKSNQFHFVASTVIVCAAAAPAYAAPSLSDKEASAIAESVWSQSRFVLNLGEWDVLGGMSGTGRPSNAQLRQLSSDSARKAEAAQAAGLVTIQVLWDYRALSDSRRGTIADFSRATSGVIKRINVIPTDRGLQLQRTSGLPLEEGSLVVPQGTFRVKQIVSNEPLTLGGDTYRLVLLAYAVQWTPEYQRYASASRGDRLSNERRAKLLFKYDPFAKAWSIKQEDYANVDTDFRTDYVSRFINTAKR